MVSTYVAGLSLNPKQIDGIVNFYLAVKSEATKNLMDGTGRRPTYRYTTSNYILIHMICFFLINDFVVNCIVQLHVTCATCATCDCVVSFHLLDCAFSNISSISGSNL